MRRTGISIFTLILIAILAGNVQAQRIADMARPGAAQTTPLASAPEDEANPFLSNDLWAVGIQAGVLSGYGLGVRFHPIGRFGGQLVGGGIKAGDVKTYSFGIEGQFDFDVMGRSRFYGYLGTGYYSYKGKDSVDLNGPWRLGIGVAYEWSVSKKLIFNASGAITYFSDGTVLPLPQIGLWYYFN
ncbi:MAG: hypothetical protein IPP94_01075 [Ignavibacteria bacterium]|nr:hypothetical protein [Ignavibacteria bacterium]